MMTAFSTIENFLNVGKDYYTNSDITTESTSSITAVGGNNSPLKVEIHAYINFVICAIYLSTIIVMIQRLLVIRNFDST